MRTFANWSPSATPIHVYTLTARIAASTCLTCSCPASRANFSVTYTHLTAHPQEQVGQLTPRFPSFSGQIVMLWATLLIVLLLPEELLHSINRDFLPIGFLSLMTKNLPETTDDKTTPGHSPTGRAVASVRHSTKNRLRLAVATPASGSVQLTPPRRCAPSFAIRRAFTIVDLTSR